MDEVPCLNNGESSWDALTKNGLEEQNSVNYANGNHMHVAWGPSDESRWIVIYVQKSIHIFMHA